MRNVYSIKRWTWYTEVFSNGSNWSSIMHASKNVTFDILAGQLTMVCLVKRIKTTENNLILSIYQHSTKHPTRFLILIFHQFIHQLCLTFGIVFVAFYLLTILIKSTNSYIVLEHSTLLTQNIVVESARQR